MFSKQEYIDAIAYLEDQFTIRQLDVLRIHLHSNDHTMTATELQRALGLRRYNSANAAFGGLARKIGKQLGISEKPALGDEGFWFPVLAEGAWRDGEYIWTMRESLKDALIELDWFVNKPAYRETTVSGRVFAEGARFTVVLTIYERNRSARQHCIKLFGARCVACGMSFEDVYGNVGKGLIQVHHLEQISKKETRYCVCPESDLRPVCANCHLIIHRRTPPYTIEEVQTMIRSQTD